MLMWNNKQLQLWGIDYAGYLLCGQYLNVMKSRVACEVVLIPYRTPFAPAAVVTGKALIVRT